MRLLITGAWKEAEKYIPLIEKQGHSVVFMQQEQGRLPCLYTWAEGVICNGLFLYHDIRDFINLKYIQLTSAGMDRVPVDYIRDNNIELHNVRGVYSVPMAEHAVSAVLNIFRDSRFFFENQAEHIWEKKRDLRELCGSKVCVIGCGSVGTECAKRFSTFGCEVTGIDLYPRDNPSFRRISGLDKLYDELPEADVVVLTLPLDLETEGLVGKKFLGSLKNGCVIVNISRGKIIDTEAMIEALSAHRLSAALDVFEDEPLEKSSPLWDMENVIITPHNSFVGNGNDNRLGKVILRGLSDGQGDDKSALR